MSICIIYNNNLKHKINDNIYNILNEGLEPKFELYLEKEIRKENENILNSLFYNKYRNELKISNIDQIKYSIKYMNNNYEEFYLLWIDIIEKAKNYRNKFINDEEISKLSYFDKIKK